MLLMRALCTISLITLISLSAGAILRAPAGSRQQSSSLSVDYLAIPVTICHKPAVPPNPLPGSPGRLAWQGDGGRVCVVVVVVVVVVVFGKL